MAMRPNTRNDDPSTREYSVFPTPITRYLRESASDSAHSQMSTRAADAYQYEMSVKWLARIAMAALPVPNHTICVPKTTQISTSASLMNSRKL